MSTFFGKEYIVKVTDDGECIEQGELIRCKDCRYYQDNQEGHYPNELCPWDKGETPDEDDYCSFAERKRA